MRGSVIDINEYDTNDIINQINDIDSTSLKNIARNNYIG